MSTDPRVQKAQAFVDNLASSAMIPSRLDEEIVRNVINGLLDLVAEIQEGEEQ